MASIAFDTLKFVRKLQGAGVPEKQAEAISEAFSEAHSQTDLVTKDYLDARLSEIKAEIESSKADTIKWMAGLLIAQAALVATLVKMLSA